ncbi:MAG TPA: adenylate/guanylate cyclase domain-containing protein [Mycobacteriales bacterium]|nr:adenylate/guanylate cyclase domain-containing protein [Mycobacteriales bacterium]
MTELGIACPVCATPTVPGARFCFHCGTSLDDTADVHGDHGAERRVVTVLFGDLSDFTAWAEDLDPERVGLVTDRVLVSLARTVSAYGGHVDKLTGDGIMAVFGAPMAHEDDAERAVRAAVQMQSDVRSLVAEESGGGRQLGLRVGLNTGEVLAGVRAALSYTVVGDAVNTASRLSDAAGVGAILAGRDTALPTVSIASWRALPPLRLKGKREPVAAYELIGLRRRASARLGLGDEAPLTGREAELGLLVSRVRDAVDRRTPTSLVLTGDAGLGKTRLWRELARVVGELPGSRVLVGRCAPYGRARDLAPVVEMVRTACGIGDDDSDDEARERARRLVSRLEHPARSAWPAASLADTLLGLLGLADEQPAAPRESAPPGETDRRGDDVPTALVWLFDALAEEGPLLLVVDDLQWSGRGLVELLVSVAERVTGPVTMLAVGRQELLERHAAWSERLPDAMLLPLAPLEAPAAERLLRAYLGGSDLDPAPRRALLDRAQGNPFFLAELLHLLVDRGLLVRADHGWVVTGELPPHVLPAGVHSVLAARIDELPGDARATLRDAAVVGSRFWVAALVALSGDRAEEVARRVATLVEHDVVVAAGEGTFTFAHTLTREVAYSGLPKRDRARRHAAIARWAGAEMPGGPAEVDVFVATQAELAAGLAGEMGLGPDDPAYSVVADGAAALARLGRSALARDDNSTAADLLGRALSLGERGLPESTERIVRVALAEALSGLHRLDEALDVLHPVLDVGPPGDRGAALVVLGEVRRKRGEEAGATEAFVRAVAAASDAGDDRVVAEALRQLGLMDYFAGRLHAAQSRFEQALELARRVGDARGTGWALQHLAWNATTLGDYPAADDALRQAADVFAGFGDAGGLAWCVGTEALVRLLQGRLREARRLAALVTEPARQVGDHWGTAACLTIDSLAASGLGDVTESLRAAREAAEIYGELGDSWGLARALLAAGAAARSAGDEGEAVGRLTESAQLAQRLRHPTTESLALDVLAWCHLDRGRLADAEHCARRVVEIEAELGLDPRSSTGARVVLGLVARARGEIDSALAVLGEIAGGEGPPTMLSPMRQVVALHAETLLAAGRVEEALVEAARATEIPAEDIRSEVVALRVLGSVLAATGDRVGAEKHLRAAVARAESTEHVAERAAARAALTAVVGQPA